MTGFSQRLSLVTSTPRIDSFPIVRLKMTATYNGSLPQPGILPGDMKITEDKAPMNFQLLNCDESRQAAIVFCIDASTSMKSSAGDSWDIYKAYYSSFDKFINLMPAGSRYALAAFTDGVVYYPGLAHATGFYFSQNAADSMDFQFKLHAQSFFGGTDVDSGIKVSARLLEYQPFQNKVIVLVTDDHSLQTSYIDSLLNAMGITLYVMEAGIDPSPLNQMLTHSTGGLYMQARDSASLVPVMEQLAELVFGEHCLIRYLSTNPCPWLKMHDISLTLNYKGLSRNVIEQYTLGRNIFDFDPPQISVISPLYTNRIVQAVENYPCTRGLKNFTDSLLKNFIKISQIRKFPNFASDSLVVGDTMQPARAVYNSCDSGKNCARKEILYIPQPDTAAPAVAVAQSLGGKYEMILSEVRSWDRGLKTASLRAGAVNFVLDSIQIITRRIGRAWLHTPIPSAEANGCLDVFDSVGNIGTYCFTRDSITGDTLAPIIMQDPVVSPRKLITGIVTEERFKDKGIKNITIFPGVNAGVDAINYLMVKHATFSVPILDSLQPVRIPIYASDSVGNKSQDSLRYDPLPDNTSPVCSIESPDAKTRLFHATELAPWDRGIASVNIVGTASNLNVSPAVYTGVYQVQQQFSVIDPFLPATAVVRAVDSLGHECVTTISIDPLLKPLIPFTSTNLIDFGTLYAPASISKSFQITNPNESPVIVTKIVQTGDLPIFISDMAAPIVFGPFEQKTFNITFAPSLLGKWNSDFSLANDTMNLTSVRAIGASIGMVQVVIDTLVVPRTRLQSHFHVAISAVPAPINLDTISFTLTYDSDLAELQDPVIDCSGNNPLCNYSITPTLLSKGRIRYDLFRKDRFVNNTLSFATAEFEVPFTCFVSQKDTTALQFENVFVSQLSTVSTAPGRIEVESECGDHSLRAFLNGTLPAWIQSLIPNPANGIVTMQILSGEKGNVSISLVDQLGVVKLHTAISLDQGINSRPWNISSMPSGSYQLILSKDNAILSVQKLIIVR